MIRTSCIRGWLVLLCFGLGFVSASATRAESRHGVLADVPSKTGPLIEKIKALGDNQWLKLGAPAADPKWGVARGRSWGGKSMVLAPELRGAFFLGEGPHAQVKPDGHGMDDIWFYDINQNRWICIYPGTEVKGFNQRVRDKQLTVDSSGQVVDAGGQPIPAHVMIHAWGYVAYDPDLHKLAFQAGDSFGRYYLPGEREMDEGLKILEAQQKGKEKKPMSPWFYDVASGKFEHFPVNLRPEVGGFGDLLYINSRKEFFYAASEAVAYYDPAKRHWRMEKDEGPRPESYDFSACYDPKRERVYMSAGGEGSAAKNPFLIYDIKSAKWSNANSKGTVPRGLSTNFASMDYDAASDAALVFQFRDKKVYPYDPEANSWQTPLPMPPDLVTAYAQGCAFYDRELNAWFCFMAMDGDDGGVMWAYRYKKAGR